MSDALGSSVTLPGKDRQFPYNSAPRFAATKQGVHTQGLVEHFSQWPRNGNYPVVHQMENEEMKCCRLDSEIAFGSREWKWAG